MSDLDGPGSRPPRLGTYQQIVSLKRKPIQTRAGPYHQAAQTDDQAEIDDEDEAVSVPTPYGSDAGVVAESASTTTTQYSQTPPAKSPQSSRSNLWMPIWLSSAALIAFAVTFFLMLLTTALLYHFSEQGNGISAQREANHYAWKYGPTAVLVVVGALWRQVDFANKILTPWEELKTGPSSADKTLLLDYISPILPVSLWMAIKNRHWAVVISITVFSTGFLILEPTTLTKTDETFQLSSKFQLSQSVNPKNAWDVGPGPAQTYYGINFYGLRFPAGTSQDFVVPEFRVPSGAASGFEYSVSTDGLQVNYDCELLPITNGTEASMPWRSIMASFIVANVTTKDCEIKGVTMAEGADHSYYHDPNATQNYQARFDLYPCNVDFDFSRGYIPPENTTLEDQIYNPNNDMRLFMSVADVRIAPSSTPNRYLYLHNVTTALCKPTYEILQFNVSVPSNVNGSAQALSSTPPAKKQVLQSYPPGSLAMAVTDTTNRWDLGTGGVDYVLSTTVPTFFQLMSKKAGFQSIRNFMDPELLVSTGTEVFKGIAAQVYTLSQSSAMKGKRISTMLQNKATVKSLHGDQWPAPPGLYSVIEVPIVQTVALQQGDVFNFNNVDLSLTDNEAAAIDNLVEYLGLNSTQWTNGNLAFNVLKQDVTFTTNSSANVPLTVNVPAVRPSLNCTSIPNDLREVTIFNQENEESGTMMFQMPGQNAMVSPSDGYVWAGVNTTLKYAEWCETAPKGMKSQEPWMQYFLLPNDTSMAYVGKASILTWGGGLVYGDGAVDTNPTHGEAADGIQETDNGCPTFAVTFGQMKLKKSGKGSKSKIIGFEQDLATLICYQNIEQVMTNATWQLPNLSFDPTQLPKANESTKELLKTSRGSERFPFLPNAWLNGLSNPLINQTIPGPNNSNSSNNYIDNFIEALVMTKNGRPADELAGAANVENLRNATQRLYGRYMAQAISLNMRDNSTAKNLPTYNGLVTISGNQRLQQSSGSKIALQVVLAVMAACAIATRLLLPVRDVLPHNPCSIAGTATLIAGGEMVSRIADKRMDMDDLLHNGLYSLKWWRDEKGAERYGIDLEPSL
ncbi:hypothetical protein TASIC1_0011012200 [Trichoderma asperellum]|uniref:Uncharacterized protein n=1 Tax=Trichoderma asperellum TaxID=101201 RepID=A0A6V8R3K5_TRIAP|nr:hypothetical protein TASIC1_0011012200 [Trichoderma asperellum]